MNVSGSKTEKHLWDYLGHTYSQNQSIQPAKFPSRHLLPTGSEDREVLGVGSIPVAILSS